MEQDKFEKRFANIQTTYQSGIRAYQFEGEADVWENVGSLPLDYFFTELSKLFLTSNNSQKLELCTYCGQQNEILENIWYFVRRVGKSIHTQNDKEWFEIGIASALLDGGRADFRDLIVSLILLRFIAEKHGIAVNQILEKFIQSSDGDVRNILRNVQSYSEGDIDITVQKFGPPDWVAELKTNQ